MFCFADGLVTGYRFLFGQTLNPSGLPSDFVQAGDATFSTQLRQPLGALDSLDLDFNQWFFLANGKPACFTAKPPGSKPQWERGQLKAAWRSIFQGLWSGPAVDGRNPAPL